ncbi:hypothetical protein ACB098_01G191100 [Castanea mollissima]|uniref:Uncharacterized protein n=1 Tax=Castanea mollissima TaxID=60419 RepID=A0A8J4VBU8_9ROSI|nr:hypothetical protein CMV_028643 [Castanea mollissima]
MKAILIVCLLLASIFFIPSSNAAEEKCDPYSRKSCRSKPPAQPLKPVAPPLKPPTPPTECSRNPKISCTPPTPRQPYIRRSPPPYRRPTPPTPGPPYI